MTQLKRELPTIRQPSAVILSLILGSLTGTLAVSLSTCSLLAVIPGVALLAALLMVRKFRLHWLLVGLAGLAPFQVYVNIGAYPIAAGYLLIGAVAALTILHVFLQGQAVTLPAQVWPFLLFFFTIFLSYTHAISKTSFMMKAVQILAYGLLYALVANVVKTPWQVESILRTIVIAATVSAALGIGQFLVATVASPDIILDLFYDRAGALLFGVRGLERIGNVDGIGFFFRAALPGVGTAFRAFGFFGGGNAYGFFQALMFPVSLVYVSRQRALRNWRVLSPVLIAVSAFLSWSRMSWLMLFTGTAYYLATRLFRQPVPLLAPSGMFRLSLVVSLTGGLALLFFVLLPDLAISEAVLATLSRSDVSTITRLRSMRRGLRLFQNHLWVGGGFGNYPSILLGTEIARATALTAESLYIELLVELGLFGLIGFMFIMWRVWKESYDIAAKGTFWISRSLGTAVCSLWIVLMVGFTFNAGITEPGAMTTLWLLIGLVSAMRRIEIQNTRHCVT